LHGERPHSYLAGDPSEEEVAMPAAAALLALVLSVVWVQPTEEVIAAQQTPIQLQFFDTYGRLTYQFDISESAYIAVFEVGRRRAELVYPAIGPELRKQRFDGEALPEVENYFGAGRHLVPPRSGRVWSGTTDTGFLRKGDLVLVFASARQFDFERLNDLYVSQGETLGKRNSFGAVDNFTHVLLRTILPDYDGDDWTAYLHWVRW
jgi:hypothetical protein